MDAMKIANSIPMWLACALPVAFVILQAVLFARGAYKSGKKLGLNDKQMKKAMKSSAVTSIGPSIVVFSAMCASHLSKPFVQTILLYDDESRPDHNERSMEECLSMCAWSSDYVCTYESCK